jgi:hypothetical protein
MATHLSLTLFDTLPRHVLEIGEQQQPQHIAPNERFIECHGTPTGGQLPFLRPNRYTFRRWPLKNSSKGPLNCQQKTLHGRKSEPLALKS